MSEKKTLKAIFAESKSDLANKLEGLSLPKDAQLIQKTVSNHLSNLFENEGSYRQNLTESEDFILQSVLRLLQSQQNISKEIAKSAKNKESSKTSQESFKSGHTQSTSTSSPIMSVAGAGLGAVAGGFIGTWGAIAGAIAGTALVIYFSSKESSKSVPEISNLTEHDSSTVTPSINVDVFSSIVESICESIDGVIETFRIQIKRVEYIYEQREKPSLITDYSALLEQIVNVYNVCSSSPDVPSKLKQAVSYLAESLENYNLKIENGKIVSE